MSVDDNRSKLPTPANDTERVEHPLSQLLFAPFRSDGAAMGILVFLMVASIGLGVLGLFVDTGHHFELESIPAFYGFYGFAGFSLAVLAGWPLGKWLRRKEGFYEEKLDEAKGIKKPDVKTSDGEVDGDA